MNKNDSTPFTKRAISETKELNIKYFFIVIVIFVSFLPFDVHGEQKGKRAIGEYDQIGLFDGDLNFSFPLLSIKGRGSTSVPLFLNIRQPIIRQSYGFYPTYAEVTSGGYELVCDTGMTVTSVTVGNSTETASQPYIGECTQVSTFQNHYVANWVSVSSIDHLDNQEINPGYGPGKFYGIVERSEGGVAVSSSSIDTSNLNIQDGGFTRVIFRLDLPDGASHTFVDVETKGQFMSWDVVSGDPTCPTRGKNFVSVDGTSMTFVSDGIVSSCGEIDVYSLPATGDGYLPIYQFPTGYLLTNDGSKYRIEQGLIKWVRDVNGNKTSFEYDSLGRLIKATDSLEREVDIVYGVNDSELAPNGLPWGLRDEIRFNGVGEQDQKIVLTKTDLGNALKQGFSLQTLAYLWPAGGSTGGLFTKEVVSSVWMPDGTAYQFEYDSYAMPARIMYPTGAMVEYDYEFLSAYTENGLPTPGNSMTFRRRLTEKRVYSDSTTLVQKSNFSPIYNLVPWGSGQPPTLRPVEVTVRDSSNQILGLTKHYFHGGPIVVSTIFEAPEWSSVKELSGKEYKTEIINPASSQVYQRSDINWRVRDGYPYPSGCYSWTGWPSPLPSGCNSWSRMPIDPVAAEVTRTLEPYKNGGLVSKTSAINPSTGSLAFDSYNNPTDSWEYEYGAGAAPANPTRHTHWEYLSVNPVNNVNYAAPSNGTSYTSSDLHIRNLRSKTLVYSVNQTSGQETLIGKGETVFDDPTFGLISESSVPQWDDPQHNYRGNPTSSRSWFEEGGVWLESHAQFDQFGNLRKVWDASGDANKFVETQYDPAYKYAYPTKVISPAPDPTNTTGTNQTSTVETTYDFATGLPLSVKDDFGQITKTEYDAFLRPIRVYADNFTAPESQTIYGVPDSNGQYPANQRFVKVRKQIDGTNWDEAITWSDGLGRTIKTQAKDSQGDVFVETVYDALGRVERVTNPYRQGDTVYWSKTRYDELGRAVETYAPIELANLANAQSLGVTSFEISTVTDYVGTVVTTTDASGRKGRSITNALGQLLRVDEPTAVGGSETNDLGALATPHRPTSYKYDLYGKMVEVTQGVQKRWFKYDSLGRLIRVRQPEQEVNTALNLADSFNTSGQWTAGFTYDVLGNVLTATDANGVTITNTYDRAGRVKTRTYSGEPHGVTTPAVSFYYDGKGLDSIQTPHNYAKGKLTKVTSSVSATEYQLFDNLGRMTQMAQITDGHTYTSKYTYNFAGALVEEEYPSGRKVKNEFESDGDLLKVTSQKNSSSVYAPYASNFSYTASGGISQMKLGNGRWETAKFNTRLQVTELGLGSSAANAGLWKTAYEYGELQTNGSVDTTKNTGNIARQTLTVPGTSFVQSYEYDSLYRLKVATEMTGSTQNWTQSWNYDRYGNRVGFAQNIAGFTDSPNPAVDANTNRFSSGQGFTYDLNGNLVIDNEGRQFTFNGDNKQTVVKDAANNIIGQYFY